MRGDSSHRNGLLAALAALALAAGVAVALLVLASDAESPRREAATTTLVGWAFAASGLIGWQRRPESRLGPLLTVAGFSWLGGGLDESDIPLAYAAGELVRPLFIPLTVHALLGFPSGHLRGRLERALVMVPYAAVAVLGPARFLVSPEPNDDCGEECPRNVLALTDQHALVEVLTGLEQAILTGAVAAAALIVAARWLAAGRRGAHAIGPTLAAAGAALVYFAALVGGWTLDASDTAERALTLLEVAAAAAVPVLLVVGLMRVVAAPAAPREVA